MQIIMINTRYRIILLLFFLCLIIFKSLSSQPGDTITLQNKKYKILSGNLISNPGFESGFSGWTDATSAASTLTSAKFSIVNTGGISNSKYLTGLTNENSSSSGSLGTAWPLSSGKSYLFAFQVKYLSTSSLSGNEIYLKTSLTNNKTSADEPKVLINETNVLGGGVWTQNHVFFTNTNPAFTHLMVRFRWLNNRFGFDDFMLYEAVEIANNYENASPENPLNLTSFINNPSFSENTSNGWQNPGTINYHVAEFYQSTFDMYQVLTELPAGKYRLKAQGFERPKANDAGAAYRAKTEKIYSKLYAKATDYSQLNCPFNSLYKHNYFGAGTQNNYLNSMSAAETMFSVTSTKYYEMILDSILVGSDGKLTIGVKSDFQQSGYWVLFDNFRLEYLGKADLNDLSKALINRIEEAKMLTSSHIQNSAISILNTAIAFATKSLSTNPPLEKDILLAKDSLDNAIQTANISAKAYLSLKKAIDHAYQIKTFLDKSDEITKLQNAIDIAVQNYSNLDLTIAQISSATSTLTTVTRSVGKRVYVPGWMLGDIYNPSNNWSIERSKQSKNWILFWEPGFGENPGATIDDCLALAEKAFAYYADSLKFIKKGFSKTDTYKMIIRLRFSVEWEATGSGVDNTIGLLTLTPWAMNSRGGQTVAHEVGHCFQYQVHCDNNNNNGWMYGFGPNNSGGNCFWEMCAQWQAYKVFPADQFSNEWYNGYLAAVHKHLLHETPRYNNFFIQDYWTYINGTDIIGQLWNKSYMPEDPIDTYKRITSVTQGMFNDQIWDCAARFATWDIPALKTRGAGYIASRPQPKLKNMGNNIWMIDSINCPENYGHNIIRLNAPTTSQTVTANFEGLSGISGFRKLNSHLSGWRIGFVALLKDGRREYGNVNAVSKGSNNGKISISFNCPANCDKLWFVVTGAPTTHWRHAWDDNDSNDEQWPYQVSFVNSNILGYPNVISDIDEYSIRQFDVFVQNGKLIMNNLPVTSRIKIVNLQGLPVVNQKVESENFSIGLPEGIYIVIVESKEGIQSKKVLVN